MIKENHIVASAQKVFTKMEPKEKPKVPAKPRTLSVAEKARNFDRLVAEFAEVIAARPIKISMSESDINKANTKNVFEESTNNGTVHIMDADNTDINTDEFIK